MYFSVFPLLVAPDMLDFGKKKRNKIRRPSANLFIYQTLISTSTPLGNSNFIKASMVLDEEL